MKVRVAQVSEAQGLADLINEAFSVEKFFIDGDRITPEQVVALLPKGEFLIAERDAARAGCVYVEQRCERAYFGLLSIDPARQRTGLGSFLVAAAEAWAREKGCRFMDLRIVNLREELPAFYQKLGYVENGTDAFPPDAPTKLPCHFVNMSKAL